MVLVTWEGMNGIKRLVIAILRSQEYPVAPVRDHAHMLRGEGVAIQMICAVKPPSGLLLLTRRPPSPLSWGTVTITHSKLQHLLRNPLIRGSLDRAGGLSTLFHFIILLLAMTYVYGKYFP